MSKKGKRPKKNQNPKMVFLRKILKPYRHTEDINIRRSRDEECRKSALLPSSRALIYSSELDYIARCIQDCPNIETGGQLYGAWTASGAPRVIYAIGPGPRANHQVTFFNQDVEYLEAIGTKLKEYGLQHIGEWHSHHRLGLPHPSGHDVQTMQNGIEQLNLSRFLLCIGSINERGIALNPFNFARDAQFVSSRWEVINSRNRLREVIDNDLGDTLCTPLSLRYTFAEDYFVPRSLSVLNQSGWFSKIENRQAFKVIIDSLKDNSWIHEVTPLISSEGIVTLKIVTRTFVEIITFPTDFPNSPFEIERIGRIEGSCTHYTFEREWNLAPNIQQTFEENYDRHLRNNQ